MPLVRSSVQVSERWRYPAKSMRGERLDVADLRADGVAGDRIVHGCESSGRVATSRFRPGLLGLQGTLGADGEPLVDGVPGLFLAEPGPVRVGDAVAVVELPAPFAA